MNTSQSFYYENTFKLEALCCCIIFSCISIFSLYCSIVSIAEQSYIATTPSIVSSLFFAKLTYTAYTFYKKSRDILIINNEGIVEISQNGIGSKTKWSEISNIKENYIFRYIKICKSNEISKINIHYRIDGIHSLIKLISENYKLKKNTRSKIKKYHPQLHHIIVTILSLSIFIPILLISVSSNQSWVVIFTITSLTLTPCIYFLTLDSVTIENKFIKIENYITKRIIYFDQIENINLKTASDYDGYISFDIIVGLKNNKKITLQNVREGTINLYKSLQNALTTPNESLK